MCITAPQVVQFLLAKNYHLTALELLVEAQSAGHGDDGAFKDLQVPSAGSGEGQGGGAGGGQSGGGADEFGWGTRGLVPRGRPASRSVAPGAV